MNKRAEWLRQDTTHPELVDMVLRLETELAEARTGFTRQDVETLRGLLLADPSRFRAHVLESLADRIEALLPRKAELTQ